MADKTEFLQAVNGAILDADSLERFINGDDAQDVLTRLSKQYPTLQKAIKQMFERGGIPATPFNTYAEMQASELEDGFYAVVTDDMDLSLTGLYLKNEGSWVKSAYDDLSDIRETVSNQNSNNDDVVDIQDVNGQSVYRATKEAKHYFAGIDSDLKTELEKYATESDKDRSSIFSVYDSNGVTTLRQDSYGNIHLPHIGNLTDAIKGINRGAQDEQANKTATMSAYLSGRYADTALLEHTQEFRSNGSLIDASDIDSMGIFDYTVRHIRVPTLLRVNKTKWIVIFEAREELGDFSRIGLGVADISVDINSKAVTVSDIKVLTPSYYVGETLWSPMSPAAVLLDDNTALVAYAIRSGRYNHKIGYKKLNIATGAWSDFVDISYVKDAKNLNVLCPCSQGFVTYFNAEHKGRVVIPVWTTGKLYEPNDYRAGFIYSDDNGETWDIADFSQFPVGNEVSCCEDINGDIIFKIRIDKNPSKYAVLARYSYKTNEYTEIPVEPAITPEPAMCSLIQGVNQFDLTSSKLMLVTCDKGRSGLIIKLSYDGGENWSVYTDPELASKRVAYTTMQTIDNKHVLIVYESDTFTNLDFGVYSLKTILGD